MSLKEYPNYETKKTVTIYTKEFKQEAVRLMETLDRPAVEWASTVSPAYRRKATLPVHLQKFSGCVLTEVSLSDENA
jgi:hypothetical protein